MLQQLTLIHRKPLGSVQYTRREEAPEGQASDLPRVLLHPHPAVITLPDALVPTDNWIINSSMAGAGFLYSKRNPYTILSVAPAIHNIVSQCGIREKKWNWKSELNPGSLC